MQKLFWFDSEELLLKDIYPFFESSIGHFIVGVNVMKLMVDEISSNLPVLTQGKQRKIAVDFRDKYLRDIFSLCIKTLEKLYEINGNDGSPEQILVYEL